VAAANAGFLGAPAVGYAAAPVALQVPAIGASQESTIRTLDGNSAVSLYSKAVDSAFSSVRKYDSRISNDAVALAAPLGVAPAFSAPLGVAPLAAPLGLARAVTPLGLSPLAAPAPLGLAQAAAPLGLSPLGLARATTPLGVASVATAAPLGVAYSAAPAVAHLTFSGLGTQYAY
jgi:hypothetical protein